MCLNFEGGVLADFVDSVCVKIFSKQVNIFAVY